MIKLEKDHTIVVEATSFIFIEKVTAKNNEEQSVRKVNDSGDKNDREVEEWVDVVPPSSPDIRTRHKV